MSVITSNTQHCFGKPLAVLYLEGERKGKRAKELST